MLSSGFCFYQSTRLEFLPTNTNCTQCNQLFCIHINVYSVEYLTDSVSQDIQMLFIVNIVLHFRIGKLQLKIVVVIFKHNNFRKVNHVL